MKIKELLIYLSFLFIMILQNIFFVGLNQFFIFTVIAISFTLLEKDKRIYFLFFMIPFRSSLPFNFINIFLILLILLTIKIKFSRVLIPAFIIFFIEILTSFESDNLINSIRFLNVLILSFLIINITSKEFYISGKLVGFYYMLGFVFTGILYILTYSQFFNIELLFEGQLRLGSISPQLLERYPNYIYFLNFNANEIGINAIFSLIFIIYNFKKSFFYFVISLITLFIGILSFSRTFILSLLILFIYLIFRNLKVKSFLIILLILLPLGLIIISAIPFLNSHILEVIYNRFLNSFDDPRFGILIGYLRVFDFGSLLFGKGAINYYYFYGQEYSVHNGIFEILFSYGLFGIILFLYFIFYLFRKSKSSKLTHICLLLFLVTIMFHQLLGSIQLIFIITVIFILIKNIYTNQYASKFKF